MGRGAGKAEGRVAPRAGRPTRECGLAAGKAPAAAGPEPASEEAVSRGPGGRRSAEAPRGEAGPGLGPEGWACTRGQGQRSGRSLPVSAAGSAIRSPVSGVTTVPGDTPPGSGGGSVWWGAPTVWINTASYNRQGKPQQMGLQLTHHCRVTVVEI